MNARTSELRLRLLRRYYKSAALGWFRPKTFHWAKVVTPSGEWRWRRSHQGIRGQLLKSPPIHLYQTLLPFRTIGPPRGYQSEGYLLGNGLLFDMDVVEKHEPFSLPRIQDTSIAVQALSDNLVDRGYIKPQRVVFSGHRGIHVFSEPENDDFVPLRLDGDYLSKQAVFDLRRERYQLARSIGKWCHGWDWRVSADIWRVVRVPWSMHGSAALVAKQFHRPFSSKNIARQIVDSTPFTLERRLRVRIKRAVGPFTFVDGENYGPFPKHWPTKLPIALALHLIWLDLAKPREAGPSQSSGWFRRGWQILFRRTASRKSMESADGRGEAG